VRAVVCTGYGPPDVLELRYTRQDFTAGDETYDVVVDAVGKLAPSRAKRPWRKTGAYLNVNRDSGSGGGRPEDLAFLKQLIEAGKVRAVIDRRYPLEEIVQERSRGRHRRPAAEHPGDDGREPLVKETSRCLRHRPSFSLVAPAARASACWSSC
jgi:NADPH:quinone reductase-like Zn-dependent oxidoreductase